MAKRIKTVSGKKPYMAVSLVFGALIILIVGFIVTKGAPGGNKSSEYIDAATEDLIIPKSELSSKAKFFPYQVGDTKIEVLALKASDGSIRTAFNTCQVCYGSGKGYYELDGTTLVCQNCRNRFSPEQVELERGGCNPVPITQEEKTETEEQITITKEYLQQAKVIFENWKN